MTTTDPDQAVRIPDRVPTAPPVESVTYDRVDHRGIVGTGGNAVVHEAAVDGHDRTIAVKEPSRDDPDETLVERFRAEGRTWARLDDHDNVVDVLDWGLDPHPWIAMERMDGGNLRARNPGLAQALWIGVRLADAVHHAHRHGVAHLDLKPDNVLFRRVEGSWDVPKVADWGLAQLLIEESGDLSGVSPHYAAPEQFDPDQFGDPDDRTDVYQLGALIYRLLTGDPPHTGRRNALADAVLEGEVVPPTGADPALPAAVDPVCSRALATEKADRYESVLDLRRDLETLLADRTDYEPRAGDRVLAADATGDARGDDASAVLDEQGFARVTRAYFADREPAPPARAWRAGLRLVDVHHGYAVDREIERETDDGTERVDLTATLVDELRDGTDLAVIGPPGSGKSTVCRAVACRWVDADHGPVYYHESETGRGIDRPGAVPRAARRDDGHALVVVEDAGRVDGVVDLARACRDRADVTLLVDARETEWTDARAVDPHRDAVEPDAFQPVTLPPPDRREYERFLAAFEEATGDPIDVGVEELLPDDRGTASLDGRGTRHGELFLFLHRLVTYTRPLDDANGGRTGLVDSVRSLHDALADAGEVPLDVGVAVAVLNAAGVGVHPELLHAVAPEEDAAVAETVDRLEGRVIFRREDADREAGEPPYRAIPKEWSTEFLAHLLDVEGERSAHERFGRVLSRVLALADDPDRREAVDWALHGRTSYLDRIAADPGTWADRTVERLFELGREWPKLTPLYGKTGYSRIDLPDACSAAVARSCPEWRGEMALDAGRCDRAEREFEHLAAVAGRVRDRDRSRELLAISHVERGEVANRRWNLDRAAEYLERALELVRKSDDGDLLATCLHRLGATARDRGRLDEAGEHFQRALTVRRELGDQRGIARTLDAMGRLERVRGDLETARARLTRSLAVARRLGDRDRVARVLHHLALVELDAGDAAESERRIRRSLQIGRRRGDRTRVGQALHDLGRVSLLDDDPDAARDHLSEARSIGEAVDDDRLVNHCRERLGDAALLTRDLDAAERHYRAARDGFRAIGCVHETFEPAIGLARVERARGNLATATDHLREVLVSVRGVGDRIREGAALRWLGRVAADRYDHDRATQRLETAAERFREAGAHRDLCAATVDLATLHADRGEVDAAVAVCEDALAAGTLAGFEARIERCRDRLAETGSLPGVATCEREDI